MTRDEAWNLLCEYTQSENLRRHALAVEACMRYYAQLFGEDEELWGVVGLLHDFDYERYPSLEEHPFRGMEILRARDYFLTEPIAPDSEGYLPVPSKPGLGVDIDEEAVARYTVAL